MIRPEPPGAGRRRLREGSAVEADSKRKLAIQRLRRKRDFKGHVLIYLAVNIVLVLIWAFTDQGFFWPIFPIVFWGLGVIGQGWSAYGTGSRITEEAIQKEMGRLDDDVIE